MYEEDHKIKRKGLRSIRRAIERHAKEMSCGCFDANASHKPLRLANNKEAPLKSMPAAAAALLGTKR